MQKAFEIVVDIQKKIPAPVFEVNTNDLKSVKLSITITNGSTLLDLTENTVRIAIRKPDDNIIFQDCTIKEAKKGLVEIVLENQAYLLPGTHTAEIMCYKGQEVVAVSGVFSYRAVSGILTDQSEESKTELTAIAKQLAKVEETIKDLRETGTGIDAEARKGIEDVTTQLTEIETIKDFEKNAKSQVLLQKLTTTPGPTIHNNDSSYEAVHPDVKYFENGKFGYKYFMLYTPYPQTNEKYENPYLMASQDGVVWTTPPGITNPIDIPTEQQLNAGYHMSDTEILVNTSGNLELIYRLNKDDNSFEQILRKTYNGTTLSNREVMYDGANSTMVLSPSVKYVDGRYVMWYVEGRNNARQIKRMTSPNGSLGTWSASTVCSVNWRNGETSERPWHLSIFTENNKCYLVLNTDTSIALAESIDNGLTYNDCHYILRPSKRANAFDNQRLYRACVVKIGNTYRMYYSAYSKAGMWGIGFVEGSTLDTMQGVDSLDATGKTVISKMVNKETQTDKLTLSQPKAYLDHKELQFFEEGVASVKVRNTSSDTMSVLKEDGTEATFVTGTLIASLRAYMGSILPVTGRYIIDVPAQLSILPVGGQKPHLQFIEPGVAAVKIGLGSSNHHMKVIRDDNTAKSGLLEISGILLQNDTPVPNVEGAIRYNVSTKKHEGYNGSTWNPLY